MYIDQRYQYRLHTCKYTLENTEGAIKKWTIQRNWQHCVHKKQNEDKQNKNTPLYVNKYRK